jgi:hypothetical protein|nr:MAG TPA: hypothetical protein [Caudoviricetes sp.]
MTEPSIAEQLLGIAVIFITLFTVMVLTAKEEQKVEVVEEKEDFYTIARTNIRNCDRKFTYDTQKPEGLRPELLALPYTKG